MRLMSWNTNSQMFECNECQWQQALSTDCTDPAERVEQEFRQHRCEEHGHKAAA